MVASVRFIFVNSLTTKVFFSVSFIFFSAPRTVHSWRKMHTSKRDAFLSEKVVLQPGVSQSGAIT